MKRARLSYHIATSKQIGNRNFQHLLDLVAELEKILISKSFSIHLIFHRLPKKQSATSKIDYSITNEEWF
jgi:hypothetical protein